MTPSVIKITLAKGFRGDRRGGWIAERAAGCAASGLHDGFRGESRRLESPAEANVDKLRDMQELRGYAIPASGTGRSSGYPTNHRRYRRVSDFARAAVYDNRNRCQQQEVSIRDPNASTMALSFWGGFHARVLTCVNKNDGWCNNINELSTQAPAPQFVLFTPPPLALTRARAKR